MGVLSNQHSQKGHVIVCVGDIDVEESGAGFHILKSKIELQWIFKFVNEIILSSNEKHLMYKIKYHLYEYHQ